MRNANLLILSVVCLVIAGCAGSKKDSKDETKNESKSKKSSPINNIGIATFRTPDGWTANRVREGYSVISIYRENGNRNDPSEKITIEVGSPLDSSVKNSAKVYAQSHSGKYSKHSSDVAGKPAFRVKIKGDSGKLGPRDCIVAHHAGKVCYIIANSKSDQDLLPVLEKIVSTWKWN